MSSSRQKVEANFLATSLAGAAQMTSLSLSVIDAAIRAGTLPVRRHGNRTLILVRDLEQWVETFPSGRAPSPPHLEGRRTGRPRNATRQSTSEVVE
jgi:hypothetical protein